MSTKTAAKSTGPKSSAAHAKGDKADKAGKGKKGTYLSIGTSLFSAFAAVKKVRNARSEDDKLLLLEAVLRAAAVTAGIVLLVRELRESHDDDILTD